MPAAGDYSGGFWYGADVAAFADAFASACAALSEYATGRSPGRVRAWTLRAADLVAADAAGRPVYGYPAPLGTPAWVAYDLVGGPVLVAGVDFDVADGYAWFDEDPVPAATVRRLDWVGGVPSEAADLFYGTAASVRAADPGSATFSALARAIAGACDSPATSAREAVEDVWQGADGAWRVVTDAAAYRLVEADTPSVAAGDVLPAGSPIGTAWELTRLGPSKPALDYLTVPAYYHQGATVGGITWYDASRPTVVDTSGGRTRVRWKLGGTQDDVDAFWAESHARGTAAGATSLARAMDTRDDPTGDPGPESLPTSVNPLEFVCRELFAGNAYLLIVRPDRFGPGAATAAGRAAAWRAAAGPYAAVFEYEDEMPALTERDPS